MSIDEMTLRGEIARAIEALPIEDSITNALGMRILAASIARGEENYMTEFLKDRKEWK